MFSSYECVLYYQIKIPISFFFFRRELNPRSLTYPLKTLLVELTRTHKLI